jgi:Ca2+:H+ antiporter
MIKSYVSRNPLSFLLLFLPAAIVLEYFVHSGPVWIFFAAALAILPLTAIMSKATERLAEHLGDGIGGFLNATFGNAPELIIGAMALRAGLYDVVKATITGSIIGNILLVFGMGALLGGFRYPIQHFNRSAASIGSTMLTLSAIGLILPAIYHYMARSTDVAIEWNLSLEIAVVLFITYLLSLFFMLKTHRHLYSGACEAEHELEENNDTEKMEASASHGGKPWTSLLMLAASAVLVSWMSEILVGAVEGAAKAMNLSEIFIGVIFVAILGNAADHASAVTMAIKNKMDVAVNITVGASIQVALFLAPVLVFLSYFIGPIPMDLLFSPIEVLAIVISVLVITLTSHDGDINWIEGVQLLAVYVMIALVLYNWRV